jgi:hypothetical protein
MLAVPAMPFGLRGVQLRGEVGRDSRPGGGGGHRLAAVGPAAGKGTYQLGEFADERKVEDTRSLPVWVRILGMPLTHATDITRDHVQKNQELLTEKRWRLLP